MFPTAKSGNLKRAKVPSFPKGKLGGVQTCKHTHTLSKIEMNSIIYLKFLIGVFNPTLSIYLSSKKNINFGINEL